MNNSQNYIINNLKGIMIQSNKTKILIFNRKMKMFIILLTYNKIIYIM